MKLTNYIRDSFVRAVTNNLPEVNYPTLDEVQQALYKKMSPKVKAVYSNEETRKALRTKYYAPNGSGYDQRGNVFVGDVELDDVLAEYNAAVAARSVAKRKVHDLAYSCNTLKQLKEAAPELVKYMPDEKTGVTAGVPAVVGVLSALKAAGFKEGSDK